MLLSKSALNSLKASTSIAISYDPKVSAFRRYLQTRSPQKIPNRHPSERCFFAFHFEGKEERQIKIRDTVRHIFSTANNIILANLELNHAAKDQWSFTVARVMIYELNFLRKGFYFLQKSNALAKTTKRRILKSIDEFDLFFGKIKDHRDVLMHFDDYTLKSRSLKGVKQKEADRIGLPVTIKAKGFLVLGNFFGNYFVSGNTKGELCEVYLGMGLPFGVDRMLRGLCNALTTDESIRVQIASGLTQDEVWEIENAPI